jgi:hypothetical protein
VSDPPCRAPVRFSAVSTAARHHQLLAHHHLCCLRLLLPHPSFTRRFLLLRQSLVCGRSCRANTFYSRPFLPAFRVVDTAFPRTRPEPSALALPPRLLRRRCHRPQFTAVLRSSSTATPHNDNEVVTAARRRSGPLLPIVSRVARRLRRCTRPRQCPGHSLQTARQ